VFSAPVREAFCVVRRARLGYADGMLWKKTWEPEAVLALIGGIVAAFFFGNLAAGLLRQAGVGGFKSDDSLGSVLVATLSFQGAAVVLGTAFLKFHDLGWREVFGGASWKRCLGLALAVLAGVGPVMFGLKFLSEIVLHKLHFAVVDQRAVELILSAKTPWLSAYLVFFAVVLAPLGEEFFFRGLLFSTAKRYGWPKLGWVGVSLLFALIHVNAPTFLPLFVLALALTWLYEKTEGLLAPVLAHSLFNAANLLLLVVGRQYGPASP
jgi:membrane protease YdiL (CAAX protease family)